MPAINTKINSHHIWFNCALLYIIIDYGRPQDLFPIIGYLRPGMIIILILTGFLILKGSLKELYGRQLTLIWLFIALLSLYIPFARNNYFAYQTTLSMLLLMPFILSIVICVNTVQRLHKLIFVLICVMIYVSLFSLFNKGMGSGNYFQDENDVALYINMWLPFCFFLFLTAKEWWKKVICLVGLLLGILTIIVSFSRGGLVGLLVVSFICWLFSPKKILSIIVICFLGLIFYFYASQTFSDPSRKGGVSYWEEMSSTTNPDSNTAKERIESWKSAWNMFLDNPWGVGGNNFQAQFPKYQTDWFQRGMWGRVAHSLWFTLIPELGVAGIILYFLLIKYNIKDILFFARLKKYKGIKDNNLQYVYALSGAFAASIAGFFSSGTFLSVLYYPHYWYLTGILVATMKISNKLLSENNLVGRKDINCHSYSYQTKSHNKTICYSKLNETSDTVETDTLKLTETEKDKLSK